jgi:hypothetical protein
MRDHRQDKPLTKKKKQIKGMGDTHESGEIIRDGSSNPNKT